MASWFERRGILDKLRQLLTEHSCEAYLVGGYVRDRLMGRETETHDLDLAVARDAIGLARRAADRLGGAFVLLDEERQTARVVLRDDDERFYVDFASLRGDSVETDLAGRDFTINAMAINAQDAAPTPQLIDPYGGGQDLDRKVVRAVSDTIFRDDPVRLLRAVRLAAELEMQVADHTEQLMRRDASLITQSSPERARDELCKTLGAKRSESSLRHLDQLAILGPLVPELEPLRGIEQPTPHYQDAFDHSLATVGGLERTFEAVHSMVVGAALEQETWGHLEAAIGPFAEQIRARLKENIVDERSRSMLLKLAGLLHDAGKGTTSKVDKNGRIRFFGHAVEGAAVAARVLRRLRFGNREVRLVQTVIRHHMRPLHLAQLEKVTRRAIHRFFRDTRGMGVDVLLHSLGDNLVIQHHGEDGTEWARICDTVGLLLRAYYEEYDEVVNPPSLVSGDDLMSHLCIGPGPDVGWLLQAVQEAQVTGQVSTPGEALRLAATLLERAKE